VRGERDVKNTNLAAKHKYPVAVARDLDPQSGQVRDIITVPTGWVVKIEVRK